MRVHTNDFKEELKVFGRQIKGKIIYYPSYDLVSESDNNILTEADLQVISEQANYDEPIEISEEDIFSISVIKNGNLLQSLMKEFDFETKEELNIGSVVNPQFGLLVNGDYEYLNYGNYIINSKEFNMDTETWSYVCYDKMLFSMVKYSGLSNIEYPITIKQFINKLCDKIGLEFEDSEFVNQEQLIYEDLYKNMNVTYRDIFDEISKIVAGNLLINDNDKLKVGYVNKAIGESEEKSGSSLEIIDGQNAELVNFELEGKTTQETRSGKNLLPSNLATKTVNGITITNNGNGTYTVNGTATADVSEAINNDFISMSGTWRMLGCPSGGSSSTYMLSAYVGYWGGGSPNIDTGNGTNITYTGNVKVRFYIKNGTTCNNLLFKPMLTTDTTATINDFEPYGVMPSPDYPSELVSVGYENLFVGADTTYANGITFIKNSDGSYNIGGTATANANLYNFVDIAKSNIENWEYYTFYVDQQLPEGVEVLAEVLNGSTWIRHVTDVLTNTRQTFTKIANLTDGTRIRYGLRVRSGYSVNIVDLKIMLIKGTIQKQYIPYGKYGIEVKTTGKNLFDGTFNNLAFFDTAVGKSMSFTEGSNYLGAYCKVEAGKTYSISKIGTTNRFRIALSSNIPANNVTGLEVGRNDSATEIENITIPNGYNYLSVYLSNSSGSSTGINIMINEGTTATEYEPYQSKTYLYTLDNPLRSIGDYKDKLYIKNGILYVDRKIGSVILDGSDDGTQAISSYDKVTLYTSGDSYQASFLQIITKANTTEQMAMSNYFDKAILTDRNTKTNIIYSYSDGILRIANEIATTKNDFLLWLSTHNTEVQYVLAESYTEELGQVDMPSTYEGITYIDTTDELEPTMNVSYISEFEEIDEQYLKDTNVRMSEKIGVINSVAILDTDNNLEYIQEDTESIKANEMTRITITNNLLALNGDTNTIALNILNKLNGLYYYANDLQTTGVCYYDYLDLFNVEARGNTYQCLLLNNEITITQGIEEHIFTEKLEEAQTSSNEYTTSVMTNKQIQFNINQQEGRIESKVEKDGVISAINQSAEEIQINADKLSFEGATIDMTADNVKIKGENLRIEGDEIEITDDGTTYNPNFSINYKDNSNLYWIKSAISSTSIWFRGKDSQYASPGYLGDFRMTLPGSSSFVPGIKMYWSQTENNIYSNYPDESEYLNLRYTEIYPQSITLYYNNKTTTIKASGITTPTLTQTSKAESKKNFEKLTNAKDILNQVDIYKYNLKGEEDNVKKSIGFVIGDKFNYSKEITSENNDGANIYSMVSVLWQVVKEQQEEINELKEMIKYGKY